MYEPWLKFKTGGAVMKCPKCEKQELKIHYFDDGTHAGYCPKCKVTYSVVLGIHGLELSRQYWVDKEVP